MAEPGASSRRPAVGTGTATPSRRGLPVGDMGDPMLVDAVSLGHEEALDELYRRYGGSLFALASRVLWSRELAEEVVQEILLRLWRRPELFDPRRGSLRSYLMAQAHSRAVDLVRSETSRRARERRDADAVTSAYVLEDEVVAMADGHVLRQAMGSLSDVERQAITLAYFGNRTYREVALLLGEPEGTIKSRIRAALRQLRRGLADLEVEVA